VDNADYQAWCDTGNIPTRWPADDKGDQTDQALQDVLTDYGLTIPKRPTSENLLSYLADKRWRTETGGILFQGLPVSTDRESQAMIGRTLQTMELTGKPVKFKTGAGFFEMDLDLMRGLSLEIAAHVQLCFETEAVISEKIEAGEIKTFEEIEVFEWPSNNA